MDILLKQARALYQDRQRIAIAAILVIFFVTFYVFYNAPILAIGDTPIPQLPDGWVAGFEVVYSFNTLGLLIAMSLMLFFYAFWTWAYLPRPATLYTLAVLRGIFGSKAEIKQTIGRKFSIKLDNGAVIYVRCKMRAGSGEWFNYQIESQPFYNPRISTVALRHGMHVRSNRFSTWVSHDELHSRLVLLTRAIRLISS